MTGIYVHIPFCRQRCHYCDFYSQTDSSLIEPYMTALFNQISAFEPIDVDTIYFGGGTPSLLDSKQLALLIGALNNRFRVKSDAEITLEANPESTTLAKLADYRLAGVNRLSLGIQSLNDLTLGNIGRIHDRRVAIRALEYATAIYDNISVDVMLALPGENTDDVDRTLESILEYDIEHISAYILKREPHTYFAELYREEYIDDDIIADIYMHVVDVLAANGFSQYEISNFARSGYRSRHNLKYWNCEEYIGIGAGAYSAIACERYHIEGDTRKYLKDFMRLSGDSKHAMVSDGPVDWTDYFILRLRTTEGLSLNKLKQMFDFTVPENMKRLFTIYEEQGYINVYDNDVHLTRKGFLVSNEILSELLLAAEL
ncbi:MAG: radical SAM family heme chaperone HemW [Oscillospiraceae bacterium]|nr:radical SAM family heme chaperone HemW [Oscillospiraceae bacterium]